MKKTNDYDTWIEITRVKDEYFDGSVLHSKIDKSEEEYETVKIRPAKSCLEIFKNKRSSYYYFRLSSHFCIRKIKIVI